MDVRRRERLGHEQPGSVLRGPPITISCERGGDHSLFLGRVEYARQHTGAPLLFHGGHYVSSGSS